MPYHGDYLSIGGIVIGSLFDLELFGTTVRYRVVLDAKRIRKILEREANQPIMLLKLLGGLMPMKEKKKVVFVLKPKGFQQPVIKWLVFDVRQLKIVIAKCFDEFSGAVKQVEYTVCFCPLLHYFFKGKPLKLFHITI